ncbi:unnamed protein product [marine sediment metagenome]|uniref:Uncharacterized protein n=1 Tax=marine sediment metagenome TaxID=412755 RepID=X1RXC1_9ZZZZ
MNLRKKIIFLGLILIFIITAMAMFSFASEEKDYINRTLQKLRIFRGISSSGIILIT